MDLMELREKYDQILTSMSDLMNLTKKEKRLFNDEESKKFAELEAEEAKTKEAIDKIERFEKLQAGKASNSSTSNSNVSVTITRGEGENENGESIVFRNLGDMLSEVAQAGKDQRKLFKRLELNEKIMRAATGLNEAVGADGGFLIQQNFSNELLKRSYETGILASRVKRVPITVGNSLTINAIKDNSRVNGSRLGGISAYWEGEADQYTASKPQFRQMGLILKKLTGICYATEELLADTGALEGIIGEGFSEEFGYKLDEAILYGTGVGQPLGIMKSDAVISVAAEGSQTTDTINYKNIVKMRQRMWARSRKNSIWLTNQDAESQLQFMVHDVGGGASVPVYLPATGISGSPYDTLWGRPVEAIEQAKTLGEKGDIMLIDPTQYLLVDKGGMQRAASVHVRFVYDEMTYKFTYRVDGQPIWADPITPANGTATLSPFITLDAR